jgi:uncharacterized protein YjbJ (UPF0337 family)
LACRRVYDTPFTNDAALTVNSFNSPARLAGLKPCRRIVVCALRQILFITQPRERPMTNPTRKTWEGRWDQFVGRVKRVYGEIADDDLMKIQGDYERVVDLIHERTGKDRNEIETRLTENAQVNAP